MKKQFALITLALLAACGNPDDALEEEQPDVASARQALTLMDFTDSHTNANSWSIPGCGGTTRALIGKEPASTTPGGYPVFIYVVGYLGNYQDEVSRTAIATMANKGFVAASVGYTNEFWDGNDCPTTATKAQCMFTASTATSAIAKLCGRSKANCSKGIVIMGHSQGGGVALLARNSNANVRAVVTMGTSQGDCFKAGVRTLGNDRHLALAGAADSGNNAANLSLVTGVSCGSTTSCSLNPSKPMPTAGWSIVPDAGVTDREADHCYMVNGGCTGTQVMDPHWGTGSYPWSLGPTLNWLNTFVTH